MYEGAVTDPADHDPEQFRYVVHGTDADSVDASLDRLYDPDEHLCASYIGRDGDTGHTTTFDQTGIIVAPAADQVAMAWHCDLGSPVDRDRLARYVDSYRGLQADPDTLLERTPTRSHNELILDGDPAADVAGVYYTETDGYTGAEQAAERMAETVADRVGHEVPVVPVPREVPDTADRPDLSTVLQELGDAQAAHDPVDDDIAAYCDLR